MKIEVQSKKGLRTILSVVVDKKTIQSKIEERLLELQKEVALKGFRPGKVPSSVIKSQFGKFKGNFLNSIIINVCYLILIFPGLYFFDNPVLSRYWFFALLLIYLIIYIRLYRLIKN